LNIFFLSHFDQSFCDEGKFSVTIAFAKKIWKNWSCVVIGKNIVFKNSENILA
jgi:hypothetical protein